MKDDKGMDPQEGRRLLSALADGDLDAADTEHACQVWQRDAAARADWHAYQLIGELMRSDRTRCNSAHDAHFLDRLRHRLAVEAPTLEASARAAPAKGAPWRRAWSAPMAIAAGIVAVAGALAVTRLSLPSGAADTSAVLSSATAPGNGAATVVQVTAAGAASAPGVVVIEGRLIRNAELDRYLAAHKEFNNPSALAVPGEVLRSSAAAAPGR